MRALLYQNFSPSFSPAFLIDSSGTLQQPEKLEPLVHYVQQHGVEATALLHWNSDAADDETMHAIPLEGQDRQLAGVLLVANSRRSYVELKRRIASVALLVAASGILLAIVLSSWAAARVTRPVEQLAAAAREVAGGNFNTRVESTSADELGDLADAFNRMTSEHGAT
jgi:HAMP domain-containing protein